MSDYNVDLGIVEWTEFDKFKCLPKKELLADGGVIIYEYHKTVRGFLRIGKSPCGYREHTFYDNRGKMYHGFDTNGLVTTAA